MLERTQTLMCSLLCLAHACLDHWTIGRKEHWSKQSRWTLIQWIVSQSSGNSWGGETCQQEAEMMH